MTAAHGSTDPKHAHADHTHSKRSASAQLGNKAGELADDLQELGEIARDAAQEKIGQLRDSASEYVEQGKDKAHQMERSLEQYICERPLKSILIAAGVGLLLGRFWMRR